MLRLGAWLVVAIALLVLLSAVALFTSAFDWRLWPAIRRARREVRVIARQYCPNANVFSREGATRIDPRHLVIWIATKTDAERDSLRQQPNIHQQLCNALLRAGYPPQAVPLVHFFIESQETVDRDYGGSWHEASEMP